MYKNEYLTHFSDTDGLVTRATTLQEQCDSASKDISSVQAVANKVISIPEEMESLKAQLEEVKAENLIYRGVLTRYSKQLDSLNEKVAMLSVRSKEKNITISNLPGDLKGETCRETVLSFLRAQVEIDVDVSEILVAHRVGKVNKTKLKDDLFDHRHMMLVRCIPELKKCIFANIKNLKGKVNDENKSFYINKQLPEMFVEQNRENREIIAHIKKKERSLPVEQKSEIEVKYYKVCLGGASVAKFPEKVVVNDFFPDKAEKDKQAKIIFATSDVSAEQNSTFLTYAAATRNVQEIRQAYHRVRILHPGADHVVAAYINNQHSGYQDDSEYGAGHRLLKHIQDNYSCVKHVAVFMVRTYGGTKLGPDRFKHMKDSVSVAIEHLINK